MTDEKHTQSLEEMLEPKDETSFSPLQKLYNGVVEDPLKLMANISLNMGALLKRNLNPTFEEFASKTVWVVMSMNLTPQNVIKYEEAWKKLYSEFKFPDSESNT